jgi:hypothetical protein
LDETAKGQGKLIGFVEPYDYAWRASFRTLTPGTVFSEEGGSEICATEAEAVKWLHTQASKLGFSSIQIRNRTESGS